MLPLSKGGKLVNSRAQGTQLHILILALGKLRNERALNIQPIIPCGIDFLHFGAATSSASAATASAFHSINNSPSR